MIGFSGPRAPRPPLQCIHICLSDMLWCSPLDPSSWVSCLWNGFYYSFLSLLQWHYTIMAWFTSSDLSHTRFFGRYLGGYHYNPTRVTCPRWCIYAGALSYAVTRWCCRLIFAGLVVSKRLWSPSMVRAQAQEYLFTLRMKCILQVNFLVQPLKFVPATRWKSLWRTTFRTRKAHHCIGTGLEWKVRVHGIFYSLWYLFILTGCIISSRK